MAGRAEVREMAFFRVKKPLEVPDGPSDSPGAPRDAPNFYYHLVPYVVLRPCALTGAPVICGRPCAN